MPEDQVEAYLSVASVTWTNLSDDERDLLHLLADMLFVACEPTLEPSIAITSAALELAAERLLPDLLGEYEVSPEARKEIRAEFEQLAALHAPGTEFTEDAHDISGRLFNRTAKERFRALLTRYGIEDDDQGVKTFVDMRNRVVHGGFTKNSSPTEHKRCSSADGCSRRSSWPS